MSATVEELRDLSRRSRRSQRTGFLALVVTLSHVPLMAAFPVWGAYVSVVAGGAALVWFAYAVGQERGAFRRVFRRMNEEKRATRSIVPTAPASAPLVELTV